MKLLLCLLLAPFFSLAQQKPSATIKGVVTYFFNTSQGDKPDIGAKVFIVDTAKCQGYDKAIAFQYDLARIKKLTRTDAGFKTLDDKSHSNFEKIKTAADAVSCTVDGSGNYSIPVTSGTYYILFQSKGRTSMTMTEIAGNLYLTKVTIKDGQTMDESHNFPLN